MRADQKPWWIDPALLGVGFLYTVFDAQLHVYRPFVIVRKPFLDSTDLGPPNTSANADDGPH